MSEEQKPGEEPEINAVAVNLADIVDEEPVDDIDLEIEDEVEEVEDVEEEEDSKGGGLADIMDDILADEAEEDDRLKAFGDLEHLTMVEVTSEVEAVLEELILRQGSDE